MAVFYTLYQNNREGFGSFKVGIKMKPTSTLEFSEWGRGSGDEGSNP